MLEQAVAIEERQEQNDDSGNRCTAVETTGKGLAEDQCSHSNVGQVADFVGSPAALFWAEHAVEIADVNDTGIIPEGRIFVKSNCLCRSLAGRRGGGSGQDGRQGRNFLYGELVHIKSGLRTRSSDTLQKPGCN